MPADGKLPGGIQDAQKKKKKKKKMADVYATATLCGCA